MILEQLKSPEEMIVYEAVTNLQNQLSIAQENTLSNFAVDQYIVALIDILKRHPESDISNEINMFAIQCLTNLMDIFPNICNHIVSNGGVKCFAQVLERSMGFIDLNEACIRALEKISTENPYAILTSGAMGLTLNMMDFFEITTQKRIIQILTNISRQAASEADMNDHLIPLIPCLCMFLQIRHGSDAAQKIESVSTIILRMCESVFRFISPHTQLDKLSQQFEKIGNTGVVDAILQSLQDYCVQEDSHHQMIIEGGGSQQQSGQKLMTSITIQNFLKTLGLCSNYSVNLLKNVIDYNVLRLIEGFLPSNEDQKKLTFSVDSFPFIMETIVLIDSLLPERESEDEIERQAEPAKSKAALELQKRALFMSQSGQQHIFFAAEKILPKIFNVHENNIQGQIRVKTLQAIDKLLLLFNEELLNNFIEPYSFAKFIYSNLRSNQLPSILLCLQMIEKLMKSNPKSYTLPLVREGVATHIKGYSSIEQLEKLAGASLAAATLAPTTETDSLQLKHEEMLKNLMQRQPSGSDQEAKLAFDQTIQKYLEMARVSGHQLTLGASAPSKQQGTITKRIVTLQQLLMQAYFENKAFLDQINEVCGDDMLVIQKLRSLAEAFLQEASRPEFDFDANRDLMKALAEQLTLQRPIMSYEFKESGLLEALKVYMTMTPKQAQLIHSRMKASNSEEVKHSEEIQMSAIAKNAQTVTKKQARCFIQRLKVFLHVILNQRNGKQPIAELVNLCHDLISQSEHLIFESTPENPSGYSSAQFGLSDPNQSMGALRQLTRRMRVNLVYDQSKASKKAVAPTLGREASMSGVEQNLMPCTDSFMAPPTFAKASSHHPAFMHLADQSAASSSNNMTPEAGFSKVYLKRNFLYTELKQVLVSVEQCASLILLEDFLRNRIKTIEDVKTLKVPPSYYGSTKSSTGAGQARIARHILSRALDRMRDMIESGATTRDRMKAENEEFSQRFLEEVLTNKDLTEMDQIDIIRQLEAHSLQMMDDFYADNGDDIHQSLEDRILSGGGGGGDDDVEVEERLFEFQRTIQRLREQFRQKKVENKSSPSKSEPKAATELTQSAEKVEDVHMQEVEEEEEEEKKREDVDMTDEEEEEQRRYAELLERKRQMRHDGGAFMLGEQVQSQQTDAIAEDLENLIKATGEDIEYEFYVAGEPMTPNQTLYEVLRNIDAKAKKAGLLSQQLLGDQVTVHFAIKDKQEGSLQKQRKDSILEFSRRDRTKSEAVEEISVSSVNQLVQQMIEREFTVLGGGSDTSKEETGKDRGQLEGALKILKVVHYLCRNSNLFTSQGMKFQISGAGNDDEELKEEGFQDLDLQVGLSQVHANLFHHHKLDAYILRNIQDPYNLISGAVSDLLTQIFRNCPMLFPFNTRLLFFKLISFIGSIDMNRSIYFLRQFLKQKLGKLPAEDKNAAKIQRQKVVVDRSRVLDCALQLISKVSNRAFLEVEYKDEIGTGQGPTLEFYYLVAQEVKGFKSLGASIWKEADNSLFPSPINLQKISNEDLQKVYEVFRLAGMIVAKSISDDKLVDLPLSPLFWDLVLGKKMNIFDLERIDPSIFKVFADLQIVANKRRDIDKQIFIDPDQRQRHINSLKTSSGVRVEDLSLTFILPGYDDFELKPEGKATDVTVNNVQEYIDLTMHFIFHESIKIQLQAFKKGFNQIFPVENLRPFAASSVELEDMICGTQRNDEEWQNVSKLAEFIVPAHGYHAKSAQYQYFLRFITELDKDEKRKFLKFVTGSPRLPNGGFGALDPKLTVVLKKPMMPSSATSKLSQDIVNSSSNIDEILPSVMTCQNYVKLPAYSSYEALKAKFEHAYNEGCNNFTLS